MKHFFTFLLIFICPFVNGQIKNNAAPKSLPQEKLVKTFTLKGFSYQIFSRKLQDEELWVYDDGKQGILYVVYRMYKGSKIEIFDFPKIVKNSEGKICRESNYELTADLFTVRRKTFAYHFGASEETTVYAANKYGQLDKKSEEIKSLDMDKISDEYIKHLLLAPPAL
jgi:hypothetical protein